MDGADLPDEIEHLMAFVPVSLGWRYAVRSTPRAKASEANLLFTSFSRDRIRHGHDRVEPVSKGRITLTPELRDIRDQTMLFVFGL